MFKLFNKWVIVFSIFIFCGYSQDRSIESNTIVTSISEFIYSDEMHSKNRKSPHSHLDYHLDPYLGPVTAKYINKERPLSSNLYENKIILNLKNTTNSIMIGQIKADVLKEGIHNTIKLKQIRIPENQEVNTDLFFRSLGVYRISKEPIFINLKIDYSNSLGKVVFSDSIESFAIYSPNTRELPKIYSYVALKNKFPELKMKLVNVSDLGKTGLANGMRNICIRWRTNSNAHQVGGHFYDNGEPIEARGVKVSVYQFPNLDSEVKYLGKENGCAPFKLDHKKMAHITVYSEALLGNSPELLINAYPEEKSKEVTKWEYYIAGSSENSPVKIDIPAGIISTMMGLGSFSAYRLIKLLGPSPNNYGNNRSYIKFYYRDDLDNSNSTINISSLQYKNQFVYGHEVGHVFQDLHNLHVSTGYGYTNDDDKYCRSENHDDFPSRKHMLRSMELSLASATEAFAHLLSALVWHNKAIPFRYYKNMSFYHPEYKDLTDGLNLVNFSGSTSHGGVVNYRDNFCDKNVSDFGKMTTELDWVRAYWTFLFMDLKNKNVSESVKKDPMSIKEFLKVYQYATEHIFKDDSMADPYDGFKTALKNTGFSSFVERWDYAAARNGVIPVNN